MKFLITPPLLRPDCFVTSSPNIVLELFVASTNSLSNLGTCICNGGFLLLAQLKLFGFGARVSLAAGQAILIFWSRLECAAKGPLSLALTLLTYIRAFLE